MKRTVDWFLFCGRVELPIAQERGVSRREKRRSLVSWEINYLAAIATDRASNGEKCLDCAGLHRERERGRVGGCARPGLQTKEKNKKGMYRCGSLHLNWREWLSGLIIHRVQYRKKTSDFTRRGLTRATIPRSYADIWHDRFGKDFFCPIRDELSAVTMSPLAPRSM